MKTNIKLHQHYDSYPKQLGYWTLWFIITALLVVLVSTVVNATETIYDLERDRSIYRDPHFTNCDDKFNNVGIEKSEFFVLHLGNVDDYILTDEVLDQWLDYEKYLKARHYDEEGEYKGLCATVAPTTPKDDFDGPSMTLEDWYKSKEKGNEEPQQVIKVQNDDNDAYEDCRDDLKECQSKKYIIPECICNTTKFDELTLKNNELIAKNINCTDSLYTVKVQGESHILQIVTSIVMVIFFISLYFNISQFRKHRINKKNFKKLKTELMKAKAGKDLLARALLK